MKDLGLKVGLKILQRNSEEENGNDRMETPPFLGERARSIFCKGRAILYSHRASCLCMALQKVTLAREQMISIMLSIGL